MKSKQIQHYFQLVEIQREVFYQNIMETTEDPWQRPLPNKWSLGETIYHLILMVRLVKRFSNLYLPIMIPYAHLRKKRPYKTEIHNIYEEYNQTKKQPMKAPFVLTPPKNPSQNYTFKDIQQLLNDETAKLKNKLSNLDEPIARHIRYPDPIAHYPNVIQSIHLLAIHEQHHFCLVEKYYAKAKENNPCPDE